MADISILSRLVNGATRNVDLSTNTLVVQSIKINSNEITGAIALRLIALQNGSDVDATYHTHDGRYFTETELGSTGGTPGASLIGVNGTPTNYSPGSNNVQAHLVAIDSALATAGGSDFSDSTFRISDNTTPSKKIAFEASGISASTVRTVTMPDANVDLGNLTNSNISASAAIAYSKLALSNSIVNADVNSAAAIAYSKLALSNSLVNADVNASAAIAESKLALDFSTSTLNTAIGTKANDNAVIKKDGSVAFTAAQSMGGFNLTNLAASTANGQAVRHEQLQAALSLIQNFEFQISALDYIVDNTAVPPTEVSGNRYVLSHDGGAPHANWDGAEAGDIVEFNGSIWVETDPTTGMMISIDDETSSLRQWGGSSWDQKYFESTTASTGLTKVGFDIRLDSSAAGDGLAFSAGVLSVKLEASNPSLQIASDELGIKFDPAGALSKGAAGTKTNVDNSTLEIATNALQLKALGITNAHVSASAAIAYAKLALSNSLVNADINSAAAIAYSKLALSNSIVDADVNASAAIAYSKLALSNSIVAGDLTSNAVTTAKINNAAVDKDKLASNVFDQDTITGAAGTSGAVQKAPKIMLAEVANESLSATTLVALRYAKSGDAGFVAGRLSKADNDASSLDNFYVMGLAYPAGAVSAGGAVSPTKFGLINAPSHGFTVGAPLFLGAAGALTTTAPTASGTAVVRVGMIKDADNIDVHMQVIGVN